MSVKASDQEESLGIFELDDNGTVIYSSFEESDSWLGAEKDITGRDFFNEVLAFTNVAELTTPARGFQSRSHPGPQFRLRLHFHQQSVPVKVLLARLCDKLDGKPRSILVHLRRSSATDAVVTTTSDRF